MLTLAPEGTYWTGDEADLEGLRGIFEARGCVPLPGFLDPALLSRLRPLLSRTVFEARSHPGISTEHCALPSPATRLLLLVLNDPELFRRVRSITGCGPIGCFEGRLYRMADGAGHGDDWHSDATEGRMVGLSIHVGEDDERAAPLQLKRLGADAAWSETSNRVPGDALLFRIAPDLVHRVAPLRAGERRTAYAGWFRAWPGIQEALGARPSSGSAT